MIWLAQLKISILYKYGKPNIELIFALIKEMF